MQDTVNGYSNSIFNMTYMLNEITKNKTCQKQLNFYLL